MLIVSAFWRKKPTWLNITGEAVDVRRCEKRVKFSEELWLRAWRGLACHNAPQVTDANCAAFSHRHASKISATLPAMVCSCGKVAPSTPRAWALRDSSSSFIVSSCSLKSSSLTASPAATPT